METSLPSPSTSSLAPFFPTTSTLPTFLLPYPSTLSLFPPTPLPPQTPAFECCTACSYPVVNAYREEGAAFVRRVCDDRGRGRIMDSEFRTYLLSFLNNLVRAISLFCTPLISLSQLCSTLLLTWTQSPSWRLFFSLPPHLP